MTVILDTSVIIDHLRQAKNKDVETPLGNYLKNPPDRTVISTVSILELFEGRSTRDSSEAKRVKVRLADFATIPLTEEIAELAGSISRDFGPVEIADAAIAATAIVGKARLFTLNQKDFRKIKGLKFYQSVES